MVSLSKSWSLTRHTRRHQKSSVSRYTRGQRGDGSNEELLFVFSDSDDATSQEINTAEDYHELRQRSGGQNGGSKDDQRPLQTEIEYLRHDVKEGETLQGIALRYGCSVGMLKQANNLVSGQDFFALQFLKIPTHKHGVLTEMLVDPLTEKQEFDEQSDGTQSPPDKVHRYWTALDKKVSAIIEDHKNNDVPTSVDVESNVPDGTPKPFYSCSSGVDCGISFWSLLGILIVVCIVIPLLYTLYITLHTGKLPFFGTHSITE